MAAKMATHNNKESCLVPHLVLLDFAAVQVKEQHVILLSLGSSPSREVRDTGLRLTNDSCGEFVL